MARIALAAAAIAVFLPWTIDGPVRLNGIQGPNNGWLVLIVVALALAWVRPMARRSRIGVAGVLGAAVVIVWTALENGLDGRSAAGASVGAGLVIVVVAGVVLAYSVYATIRRP